MRPDAMPTLRMRVLQSRPTPSTRADVAPWGGGGCDGGGACDPDRTNSRVHDIPRLSRVSGVVGMAYGRDS